MRRLDKDAALAAVAREVRSTCGMCGLVGAREQVASSEHAVAVLDRYASRPGHVLVVARRHEEHIAALSWDEYADLQRLAWTLTRAMMVLFSPRRIFVAALGSDVARATSFPHVHLHLVPLHDGGEEDRPAQVFTWERGVFVFEDGEEERAMREQLQAALAAP